MATPNKALQQILHGIGQHANSGRLTISWSTLTESRNRRIREAEGDKEEKDVPDLPDLESDAKRDKQKTPKGGQEEPNLPDLPSDDAGDEGSTDEPKPDAAVGGESDTEDVDAVKADAEKAKAELEKAKAEKDQAEQELEQNSYIKLNTPSGISFLLGKLLDKAFKTNTIDSLASDFVNKLKITNPDDFSTFSADMVPYKNLVGMAEFLQSVKTLSANAKHPTNDGEE